MASDLSRPAFYALAAGGRRDWVTLLHPPYTAWHLGYVTIGAALAPELTLGRLGATLGAFFLAVGIGAHALDELAGRPLGTLLPASQLRLAAALSLAGAVAIGTVGAVLYEPAVAAFIPVGVFIVCAYNLELAGGRFHGDTWFALAWGGFPVLAGFVAMTGTIRVEAVAAAAFAVALSHGQRRLSRQARHLRRHAGDMPVTVTLRDGSVEEISRAEAIRPCETALQAMALAVCLLALALVLARVA